ncbi:MAG: tetratricopeptide repeat protein [Gammaproteobacteria bacterium]|nr:tetratricopeptide repeat protein [Gammaproteobacteria bacterium]
MRVAKFWLCLALLGASVHPLIGQEVEETGMPEAVRAELDSLPEEFKVDLNRTRVQVLELQGTAQNTQVRADAWGNLGMIYHGQQLTHAAIDAYGRALALYDDSRWHYLRAVIFLGRGDTDTALAHLQQTVLLSPDYAPAWYRLSGIHLDQGEFDRAKNALIQAREHAPNSAAILVRLADVELETEQLNQALDYLTQAWAIAPESGQIAYKIAQIYQIQGDDERFNEWITMTRGIRNPPQIDDPLLVEVAGYSRNSRFFIRAADWAIQQGDISAALSAMKSATEVDPENQEVLLNYATLLFMAQKTAEGIEEVKKVLEKDIDSSRGWYRLAWMLRRSTEPEEYLEGLVAIQKSLEIEESADARRLSAALFIGSGQFDDAENDYLKLLEDDPENAYYHYWLGMVQLAQNNCEGLNSIKRTILLKKDFGEAHLVLSRAEALCGETDKALARIDALIKIRDDIDTRLAQAYIRLLAGDMNQIQDTVEAALPHPDAQMIMNALDSNEKPRRLFELGSPWWIPQELQ